MLIICLKIFLVRIVDVSLGTVRTIFMIKEKKVVAALIAFVEVFIWFVIVQEALSLLEKNMFVAVAYAGGFSVGTFIGGILAKKIIRGKVTLQAFISYESKDIIKTIRDNKYAVTAIEYNGIDPDDKKYMLYINIDKKEENKLKKLILSLDSDAFIVVNESKYVYNGYFK